MYPPIQILIPSAIISMKETYLRGVIVTSNLDRSLQIYFTAFSSNLSELETPDNLNKNYIYGYYNKQESKNSVLNTNLYSNYLEFHSNLDKGLRTLVIEKCAIISPNLNNIIIYYDHTIVKHSENLSVLCYDDVFTKLLKLVQDEQGHKESFVLNKFEPLFTKPNWLTSTMFGQHLLNYVDLINWIKCCIKHDKKVSKFNF